MSLFNDVKSHNEKIYAKIRQLEGEVLVRYSVKVIQRLENGKRSIVVNETTKHVPKASKADLYKDYRALYPEQEKFFIVIEEVEDIKRTVKFREPMRDDSDREPPSHLGDPIGVEL